MRIRPAQPLSAILLLSLVSLFAGCQGSEDPSSEASGSSASSAGQVTSQQAPSPVQVISTSYNQTPQYALTDEDLALLQSQEVISGDEARALASLVRR